MTNQEAIETIKIAIAEVEWNYPMDYSIAFDMAITALEKQIPKKPYIQQDDRNNDCMECPSCDSFIGYEYDCRDGHYQINYCNYCGQKLDWSDEE